MADVMRQEKKSARSYNQSMRFCFLHFFFLIVFLCSLIGWNSQAENSTEKLEKQQAVKNESSCTLQTEIIDAVGPATLDLLQRAIHKAKEENCTSLLVLINTPGGNLQSTRYIVEEILASPLPFLCLVYPNGGHAGSAGAIILQACHVAGAMEATNIGAATPISGSGEDIPKDLRQKLLNDTRSWVEGLTKLRHRSETFGRDIILEAKAVNATEAYKLGALDFVATKKQDFLEFSRGRVVHMSENQKVKVEVGPLRTWNLDLRYKIVSFFSDPQMAYLIFMISLGLIYLELTHPGLVAPGVIGAGGLVLSLIAFHKLDVTWGALALVFLGLVLMVAEAFVAGFGVLGIGGVISFMVGSLILFDPATTGIQLPLSLVLSSSLILGLLMMGLAYLAFNSRQAVRRGTFEEMMGQKGRAVEVDPDNSCLGRMSINGELWRFQCEEKVSLNDSLLVKGHSGLTVTVERTKEI